MDVLKDAENLLDREGVRQRSAKVNESRNTTCQKLSENFDYGTRKKYRLFQLITQNKANK